MLRVNHLSKTFGGLQAVADVSFEVPAGRIVALIGPNGAGKTTLFAMVSGFLRPDAGTLTFDGEDITNWAPSRCCARGLVRTFQITQPFGRLTVRENIAIGAYVRVRARQSALARAETVAARVGLAGQLDLPATSLTLAGRKRLELARALATEPKLLLLDEVMAGLTPTEIVTIVEVIRGIRDSGVTVLLTEHVMQAVVSLSDWTYVINNGALIASGTTADVAANPKVIEAYLGSGTAGRVAAHG